MEIEIVIAVQDYREHGYLNTVSTDKGMILIKNNEKFSDTSKKIASIFNRVIGNTFSNEDLVLPANSYSEILDVYEKEIRELLKKQKRILDPDNKYDQIEIFFNEEYVINRRNDEDDFLEFFYDFYILLKKFYDYGYPLYITPATPEDIKKYFGSFKAGDSYEPIFQQA